MNGWLRYPDVPIFRETNIDGVRIFIVDGIMMTPAVREFIESIKRIVIIGAGPVGMVFAYQLASRTHTPISITILEKRPEYTRQQYLAVGEDIAELLPPETQEKLFGSEGIGCRINTPAAWTRAQCYVPPSLPIESVGLNPALRATPFSIQISKLEEVLAADIETNYATVIKPVDVQFEGDAVRTVQGGYYPFDILVGADGSRSKVREDILKCQTRTIYKRFRYVLIIMFTAEPGTYDASIVTTPRKDLYKQGRVAQPYRRIFRSQDGSQLYIGLSIPRETAERVQQGSDAPQYVKQQLHEICQSVYTHCFDKDIPDQYDTVLLKIQPQLSANAAGQLCVHGKTSTDKPVFIIGDAVKTVDIFTGSGVNNGIAGGTSLAKDIAQMLDNQKPLEQVKTNHFVRESRMVTRILGDTGRLIGQLEDFCVLPQGDRSRPLKPPGDRNLSLEDIKSIFGYTDVSVEEVCFINKIFT